MIWGSMRILFQGPWGYHQDWDSRARVRMDRRFPNIRTLWSYYGPGAGHMSGRFEQDIDSGLSRNHFKLALYPLLWPFLHPDVVEALS